MVFNKICLRYKIFPFLTGNPIPNPPNSPNIHTLDYESNYTYYMTSPLRSNAHMYPLKVAHLIRTFTRTHARRTRLRIRTQPRTPQDRRTRRRWQQSRKQPQRSRSEDCNYLSATSWIWFSSLKTICTSNPVPLGRSFISATRVRLSIHFLSLSMR